MAVAEDVTVVEVIREYLEGRVEKLSDGSVRLVGIYDDPDAPMVGRVAARSHVDPPPRSQVDMAATTLRGCVPIRYVEREPWNVPPPKAPSPSSQRIADEDEARRRAYDDWKPEKRRPEEPTGPGAEEIAAMVVARARKNAEVVYAKWMQGL